MYYRKFKKTDTFIQIPYNMKTNIQIQNNNLLHVNNINKKLLSFNYLNNLGPSTLRTIYM
jgi:hypothetical protein